MKSHPGSLIAAAFTSHVEGDVFPRTQFKYYLSPFFYKVFLCNYDGFDVYIKNSITKSDK